MIWIITVTYNDKDNLRFTLDSVRRNKKSFQKYIIIDGNSKDDTLSVIKEYSDVVDSYISEPDKGLYDAMNKALSFGAQDDDYLIWINAGDELTDWGDFNPDDFNYNDAIFAAVIKKSSREVEQKGILVKPVVKLPYNEKNFYPRTLYQHQGFFIKVMLFKELRYDIKIGLQAENLLMSQAIIKGTTCTSDAPVSVYYNDGISNNNTFNVLKSYFKVVRCLGFSTFKVGIYHLPFIIKSVIYGLLPKSFVENYKKAKYK